MVPDVSTEMLAEWRNCHFRVEYSYRSDLSGAALGFAGRACGRGSGHDGAGRPRGSVLVEPLLAYRPARLTILETAGTLMPNSRARSAMSSPAERRRRTSSIISSVIRRGRPGENRAGFLRRRDSARIAT